MLIFPNALRETAPSFPEDFHCVCVFDFFVCESMCVHTAESDVDYHTAAISVSAGVLSVCLYMSYSSALSPVLGFLVL